MLHAHSKGREFACLAAGIVCASVVASPATASYSESDAWQQAASSLRLIDLSPTTLALADLSPTQVDTLLAGIAANVDILMAVQGAQESLHLETQRLSYARSSLFEDLPEDQIAQRAQAVNEAIVSVNAAEQSLNAAMADLEQAAMALIPTAQHQLIDDIREKRAAGVADKLVLVNSAQMNCDAADAFRTYERFEQEAFLPAWLPADLSDCVSSLRSSPDVATAEFRIQYRLPQMKALFAPSS